MSAVEEALSRYLEVEVVADEWDAPPSLALIIQDKDGTVDLSPIPLGDVWGAAPPYRVIWAAGQTAKQIHDLSGWSPLQDGETLLGVMLFNEGWGLSSSDPAKHESVREYAEHHRIADHPDRVEFKMVNAVLADGTVLTLMHPRNGETDRRIDGANVEGRVPDALRGALAAFQEVVA